MSNRPGRKVSRYQASTDAASARSGSSRVVWFVVGAIVVVAAIVGVVVALGGDDDTDRADGADAPGGLAWSAPVDVGFAEIIGDPLPRFEGQPDPATGIPAPSLRATDMRTGERDDLDLTAGKVTMVGFFAHWCSHCQAEVPRVVERVATTPLPDGVEMIAVSTAMDEGAPNWPPTDWFIREGWPFPAYTDTADGALANGFGLSSFPYWVVVGPDGTVVARAAGEMTDAEFTEFVATAAAAVG